MPPSEDSVSLHAPTISSIYSAWSSVGLTIGAVSLDAATKPLIGLMLHQKASKNIAVTRGIPLTQESARSLVEYLLYRDTFKRTRLMVMQEFFSRAEAGEDMHVITATFEWCLDNLFLTRCSAEEVRAYDILEHLSKHRALCSHFADFRAIVKRQSDPEFNDGVRRKTLTLHPTYLHKVFIYDGNVIELQICGPSFQYVPGQWLFLQVPELSRWRWHAFTIASSPHDPYISVYIRFHPKDEWIRALAKHLDAVLKDVSSPTETTANVGPLREEVLRKALPGVRIFGPFGGFAEGVFRTEFAVLIGFGFGAVPLISILKDLLYRLRMDKPNIALRRLKFIWVVRDTQSIGWFSSALCEVEAAVAATRDPGLLTIDIYLTHKLKEDVVWNMAVNYPSAERDPITHLRTPTNFGRPDFKSIYSQIKSTVQGGSYKTTKKPTTVKTYFCGPEVPAKQIKDAIACHTNGDIQFTFAQHNARYLS